MDRAVNDTDDGRAIGVGNDAINGAPEIDVSDAADNDRSINATDSDGGDEPGAAMIPTDVVALPLELEREHRNRVEPVLSTNAGAGSALLHDDVLL